MASVKFIAVLRGLKDILEYITNREKTIDRLITGVNCVAQTAQAEFEVTKKQFRKTDGRSYYHIVQAFSPDDPLDFETAHQIGLELAGYFQGFQCVVATHMNTAHIRRSPRLPTQSAVPRSETGRPCRAPPPSGPRCRPKSSPPACPAL